MEFATLGLQDFSAINLDGFDWFLALSITAISASTRRSSAANFLPESST
jgi:hypothetical protein